MSSASLTVALGVTGSIAAFKAVEIARLLIQRNVRVLPVLTRSAMQFVGPTTFTGICGEAARSDMWDPSFPGELHVHLAASSDAVLVAPATADVLARMAGGRADDLLTALVLCARSPVVAAPAMHPRMWAHPATQGNVRTIVEQGRVQLVGPVVGPVANGEVGMGRMAEPADIVEAVLAAIGERDLAGVRIVVTAGPTVEDIDPVRFLSNRSSGRMGYAVAERAARRGAQVVLISGPTELATPVDVRRIDVRSALEMQRALRDILGERLNGADVVVKAAAVGDYRPAVSHTGKQKRSEAATTLELVANPDLLAELGAARNGARPVLIGFAVESVGDAELVELARGKLVRKGVDMIVANRASEAFGGETNRAVLVTLESHEALEVMSKHALADRLLDRARELLGTKEQ